MQPWSRRLFRREIEILCEHGYDGRHLLLACHVLLRRVGLERVCDLVVDARQQTHKVQRLVTVLRQHAMQRLHEP